MQPPYVLGRAFPAKGWKKRLTKSKGFHLEHLRRHIFGYFCLIDFSQGAQWKKNIAAFISFDNFAPTSNIFSFSNHFISLERCVHINVENSTFTIENQKAG